MTLKLKPVLYSFCSARPAPKRLDAPVTVLCSGWINATTPTPRLCGSLLGSSFHFPTFRGAPESIALYFVLDCELFLTKDRSISRLDDGVRGCNSCRCGTSRQAQLVPEPQRLDEQSHLNTAVLKANAEEQGFKLQHMLQHLQMHWSLFKHESLLLQMVSDYPIVFSYANVMKQAAWGYKASECFGMRSLPEPLTLQIMHQNALRCMYACMHICMYACMHVRMHFQTLHIYIYIYMCVHMESPSMYLPFGFLL